MVPLGGAVRPAPWRGSGINEPIAVLGFEAPWAVRAPLQDILPPPPMVTLPPKYPFEFEDFTDFL